VGPSRAEHGAGEVLAMVRVAYIDIDGRPYLRCAVLPELAVHVGDLCIAEVKHVLEFGPMVSIEEATDAAKAAGDDARVLRRATLQDQAKADENALLSKMALETCEAKAAKYELKIRLVRARYSFDRSVLKVRFSADESVDLRELTKELVAELRARVDLEQIGVRDEAGIVGGVGSCGRVQCCCSWLRRFESINVKMAKAQGLSLNPGSISGNCGRLKCCLRYEYDVYREIGRRLPHQGARVECPDGNGRVIGADVLVQRVKVRLDDDRILSYGVDQLREIRQRRRKDRRSDDEDPGRERTEPEATGDTRTRSVRNRHAR